MAGSVNKVILVGNVGRDPETKTFANGGMVCDFSVATEESWRDKQSGERRQKTEWHSIAVRNEGLAKVAQQYIKKGTKVYIEGQLQTRKWQDNSGNDRFTTEVVLSGYGCALSIVANGRGGDTSKSDRGGGANERLDDEVPF